MASRWVLLGCAMMMWGCATKPVVHNTRSSVRVTREVSRRSVARRYATRKRAVRSKRAVLPSMRARVLAARKAALKLRKHQRRLWEKELFVRSGTGMVRDARSALAQARKRKPPTDRALQARIRRFQSLERSHRQTIHFVHKMRRYIRYLRKREPRVAGVRWRGQMYIHPQRGPLFRKEKGARLLESLASWRQYCARRHPPQQTVYAQKGTRSLRWMGRSWRIQELQAPSVMRPSVLLPHRRYLRLSRLYMHLPDGCAVRPLQLWDLKRGKLITLPRPPLAALFAREHHLLPWLQGLRHSLLRLSLLAYDAKKQRATLLLIRPQYEPRTRRRKAFLLRWDLRQNKLMQLAPLPQTVCSQAKGLFFSMHPTRPDTFLFINLRGQYPQHCVNRLSKDGHDGWSGGHSLMSFHIPTGKQRHLLSIEHSQALHKARWSSDGKRLALVEYHINTFRKPSQVLFLDLSTGKIRRRRGADYPYGLTFSADDKQVFVYGCGDGKVRRFDFQRARRSHTRFVGGRGHAAGISRDGRLLFVIRHKGITALSTRNLRKRSFLPIRRIIRAKGFIHVAGSQAEHGALIIRNGNTLTILSEHKPRSLANK